MLQCWASKHEFYIGGSTLLCQFIEPVTFVRCAYSILCPFGPGALSGSKKLKRRTVLIQKEPVSRSFVRPNRTRRTSCLVFNSLSIAVAAILPLRIR